MNDTFTKLHNEVLDALAMADLPAEARILFVIWRKTYGFRKKSDKISASQFIKMTRLSATSLYRALQSLQDKKIIVRKGSWTSFSKTFMQNTSPENGTTENGSLPKTGQTSTENGNFVEARPLPKTVDTKEIKENIKESPQENKKGDQTTYSKYKPIIFPAWAEKEFRAFYAAAKKNDGSATEMKKKWTPDVHAFFSQWLWQNIDSVSK